MTVCGEEILRVLYGAAESENTTEGPGFSPDTYPTSLCFQKDLVRVKEDKLSIGCSMMIQNSGHCIAYSIVTCKKASQCLYL